VDNRRSLLYLLRATSTLPVSATKTINPEDFPDIFRSRQGSVALHRPKRSPNHDTLYTVAWLDVGPEPMIITVPAITDRFWCMQMACIDSDNFTYIGSHITANAAASYLVSGPGWNGPVPDDVRDVLPRSRTLAVLIFGRTGVNDDADGGVVPAEGDCSAAAIQVYPALPGIAVAAAAIESCTACVHDPVGIAAVMRRLPTPSSIYLRRPNCCRRPREPKAA
jgi:uncharacterized protein DUF1254